MTRRHKVFISFHEDDIALKEDFVLKMGDRIVDKSVHTRNIEDTGLTAGQVRQIIRNDYILDATVTVVLIGPRTWQRKFVDWEIGASIGKPSPCGLVGIFLPNHSEYRKAGFNDRLVPPRLADNCRGRNPYAVIYNWPDPWNPNEIERWVEEAYLRTGTSIPVNSRKPFTRNRSRGYWKGWQN